MAMEFRRGTAAIEKSATSGGGSFRSFVPSMTWREDGESKYALVITPLEEVFTVLLHEWIPVGKGERADGEEYTNYEWFLSRKDPAIGEDYDDIQDRLERDPRDRSVGILAELEPVLETRNGRQRVKSFAVKTDTYMRKDQEGNEEEVTQPVLGICIQSPRTLWGTLSSVDNSQGPLYETPVEIIRRGADKNTRYDVIPFQDVEVDLSPVIEYLDGISYLSEDMDEVINAVEAAETDIGQAQAVADFILSKRLEELADKERYDELVGPLEAEDIPSFGGGKKKAGKKTSRPARKSRQTRRESQKETTEAPSETSAENGDDPAGKDDRFAALKARLEKK